MLMFGLIQIIMSQIPDFHNMEWLSVVAAIMSFTYSFIGLGLGFAKVIGMAVYLPSFRQLQASNFTTKTQTFDKLFLSLKCCSTLVPHQVSEITYEKDKHQKFEFYIFLLLQTGKNNSFHSNELNATIWFHLIGKPAAMPFQYQYSCVCNFRKWEDYGEHYRSPSF